MFAIECDLCTDRRCRQAQSLTLKTHCHCCPTHLLRRQKSFELGTLHEVSDEGEAARVLVDGTETEAERLQQEREEEAIEATLAAWAHGEFGNEEGDRGVGSVGAASASSLSSLRAASLTLGAEGESTVEPAAAVEPAQARHELEADCAVEDTPAPRAVSIADEDLSAAARVEHVDSAYASGSAVAAGATASAAAAWYDDALERCRAEHAREMAGMRAALQAAMTRAAELEEREAAREEAEIVTGSEADGGAADAAWAAEAAKAASRPQCADAATEVALAPPSVSCGAQTEEIEEATTHEVGTQACGQSPSQQLLVEHARAEIVRLRAVNERLLDSKVAAAASAAASRAECAAAGKREQEARAEREEALAALAVARAERAEAAAEAASSRKVAEGARAAAARLVRRVEAAEHKAEEAAVALRARLDGAVAAAGTETAKLRVEADSLRARAERAEREALKRSSTVSVATAPCTPPRPRAQAAAKAKAKTPPRPQAQAPVRTPPRPHAPHAPPSNATTPPPLLLRASPGASVSPSSRRAGVARRESAERPARAATRRPAGLSVVADAHAALAKAARSGGANPIAGAADNIRPDVVDAAPAARAAPSAALLAGREMRERLARAREQEEATREQVVFAAQAEAQLLLQRKAKLQETLRQLRASGEGVAARAQRLQVVSSAK